MPLEGQGIREAPSEADAELLQRLRSANGHLQAVIAMIEAGESCESVFHQLCAVQSAIAAARRTLIRCQVQQISSSLMTDSRADAQADTVMRLTNLYSLLIKAEPYR
jgi:DNA-binding FrmR family transcriptional regulator